MSLVGQKYITLYFQAGCLAHLKITIGYLKTFRIMKSALLIFYDASNTIMIIVFNINGFFLTRLAVTSNESRSKRRAVMYTGEVFS